MNNCIAQLLTVVVTSLLAWSLFAQPVEAANDLSVEQLIARLGAREFEIREDAARRLETKGLSIRDELLAGAEHPDLEVRLRCNKILLQLNLLALEERLQAFIDDIEGKQEHDLPGWDRFRKVAGDDLAARKLFVEIFRQERDLLDAAQWTEGNREAVLLSRITETMNSINGRRGVESRTSPIAVAAVLLIAAQEDVKLSVHCDIQLFSLLSQTAMNRLIDGAESREPMRRLLASWVANSVRGGNIPQYPLMVALQYDLKESTLELGRELIAAAGANRRAPSTSTLPYLLLAVGKFGGDNDIELIEKLLDNKTVCHTWHTGRHPEPIKIEVRDVALVVLLHLTSQQHKDYGFELLQPYARTLYSVHTCGFAENEKREAAMAKWRVWHKSHAAE